MTESNSEIQIPALQRLGGAAIAAALKSVSRTLDLKATFYDRSADPSSRYYDEHVIFVFWHEYIFPLLPSWANCPLTLLVSQHRDAEWLNQAAIRMGYTIVRGSTSRGGTAAIRQLKRHSRQSSFAITPDGPRGPRREMAAGPIFLASLFDMPIVPVGVGIQGAWRMNTWDRFAIPKPCSAARVVFGPKIRLARKKRNQHEAIRARMEQLLHQFTHIAESWAEGGYEMSGQVGLGGEPDKNRREFEQVASQPVDRGRPRKLAIFHEAA